MSKISRLSAVLFFMSATSLASGFCEKLPIDPELPAGLDGQYEIVGRNPKTGVAYAGTLAFSYGKNSYELKRTVQGKSVNGEAWMERCGMDKIMSFHARYYSKPVTELGCSMSADGDNYHRLSCRTRQGEAAWAGLEAWFQKH